MLRRTKLNSRACFLEIMAFGRPKRLSVVRSSLYTDQEKRDLLLESPIAKAIKMVSPAGPTFCNQYLLPTCIRRGQFDIGPYEHDAACPRAGHYDDCPRFGVCVCWYRPIRDCTCTH